MKKTLLALAMFGILAALASGADSAKKILILHDELPQMKVLAKRLEAEGYGVDFVTTKEKLPPLDSYAAVVVFVHGALPREQAQAVIDFTRAGGRTICLHHTISSGKRKTPIWLDFLGMDLPAGDLAKGGYKWQHDVDLVLVNLAPGHFITTNKITYPSKATYKRSDVDEPARERDSVVFPGSEAFINHQFTDGADKTILLGFIARHPALGDKVWMQDRGGWYKQAGKGWVFYFIAGHTAKDLENPIYQQIILNALTWTP